ncbi:putative glycosyltransferase [Scytonema sp. HK-05]|uniref:glycosyltransferase family 2 protein n=1 Tax=Scytonema sp. HK-05 TaxID=1137095 RepID=UPI000937C700|nr:glycosyltransferase family 2 protein [Scytonema sp. HK-05]OKH60929.1 glycosyltransferase [Scytonema sp. HK-05]BAY46294.1 putative glycosyltransferase [Scytonema sp. HK-05]
MLTRNTALTLKDLPPPPPGKSGWPWTEQNEPLPERMPDGSDWPRMSIVTPSYNYGLFIEETIRSVLLQGYPNLEYIIIDGGSTDNTVEIVQKYEQYLTYWVSEPDKGQTDAINKGYQYCTGDLFVWLNADDAYINHRCLSNVAEIYRQGYQLIVGECFNVNENEQEIIITKNFNGYSQPQDFDQYLKFWSFVALPQPAVFVAKQLSDSAFPLNKNLYGTMDYQLFLRVLSQKPKAIWVKQTWVKFKYHGQNKTLQHNPDTYSELYQVALSEAKRVYTFRKRIFFQIAATDYIHLQSLIYNKSQFKFLAVLKSLLFRPTLVGWYLFWAILIKAGVGEERYLAIKNFLKF